MPHLCYDPSQLCPTSAMSNFSYSHSQLCPTSAMPNLSYAQPQLCLSSAMPNLSHAPSQSCPTLTSAQLQLCSNVAMPSRVRYEVPTLSFSPVLVPALIVPVLKGPTVQSSYNSKFLLFHVPMPNRSHYMPDLMSYFTAFIGW